MLDQFTITKAIHNRVPLFMLNEMGWNARSIYNYESHSQHAVPASILLRRLECSINLQLRKPFTTCVAIKATPHSVGMLDQFTITKAIHNVSVRLYAKMRGWNARSIYNYESHSQRHIPCLFCIRWLECSINLQLRKPFTTGERYGKTQEGVGMLDQFTITKAIHNRAEDSFSLLGGWNARSIYNYESHSQQG